MADNSEEILESLLEGTLEDEPKPTRRWINNTQPTQNDGKSQSETAHSQWAIGSNGKFIPVGGTVDVLPAGVYSPWADQSGFGVELLPVTSDGIYSLPDMATEDVLAEINKFWSSEERYRKHNLLYKRGLLLWGPPGGGKTVTVKLLMAELVKNGGIVVIVNNIAVTLTVLKALRRIEPNRNLITVFEDIDEIINYQGEASVLSMLDGEHNIDNILQLATTNYPARLGARIINRPSRFDRRVYVGMPAEAARRVYFQKATQDGLRNDQLEVWTKDTDGLSIAHLRELVASVYCLDQDYSTVVNRLKKMGVAPKDPSGFGSGGGVGFGKGVNPV